MTYVHGSGADEMDDDDDVADVGYNGIADDPGAIGEIQRSLSRRSTRTVHLPPPGHLPPPRLVRV